MKRWDQEESPAAKGAASQPAKTAPVPSPPAKPPRNTPAEPEKPAEPATEPPGVTPPVDGPSGLLRRRPDTHPRMQLEIGPTTDYSEAKEFQNKHKQRLDNIRIRPMFIDFIMQLDKDDTNPIKTTPVKHFLMDLRFCILKPKLEALIHGMAYETEKRLKIIPQG